MLNKRYLVRGTGDRLYTEAQAWTLKGANRKLRDLKEHLPDWKFGIVDTWRNREA